MRGDVTALEMRPAGGEVTVGTSLQLNLFGLKRKGVADLIPGNMAVWSGSDNHIAEVNRQGRLTPRRPGSLKVTASYADKKVEAVFTVVAGVVTPPGGHSPPGAAPLSD
jgi:hypothetical protein